MHRDFKPDNVLVGEDGRVRVVDFGLARALDGQAAGETASSQSGSGFSGEGLRSSRERLTQVGTIMGTPGFMSPEQISGQPTDERSDQWSFCAALYEALYGALPFVGETFEEFAAKVVAGELPAQFPSPPTGVAIPAVIESALRRGLSRKPEERFPSMAALTAALEVGLSAEADSRESQRIKRRVALIVGLLAVLLVGVRQATWARVQPESLWGPTLLSFTLFACCLAVRLVLRPVLRRQLVYRRGAYFLSVLTAYMALGRTLGLFINIPLGKYLQLETLGLSMFFLTELPLVGRYYVLPVLTCWISVGLQVFLPQYRIYIMNITYLILMVSAGYLRVVRDSSAPPQR